MFKPTFLNPNHPFWQNYWAQRTFTPCRAGLLLLALHPALLPLPLFPPSFIHVAFCKRKTGHSGHSAPKQSYLAGQENKANRCQWYTTLCSVFAPVLPVGWHLCCGWSARHLFLVQHWPCAGFAAQEEMVSLAVSSEFWNTPLLGFLFIFCLVTNLILTERSKPWPLKSNIVLLATAGIRVWTR